MQHQVTSLGTGLYPLSLRLRRQKAPSLTGALPSGRGLG
jgi:hypothetical protein